MPTLQGLMLTNRPERYARQLFSHWAQRGAVSELDGVLSMTYPDGRLLVLRCSDGRLEVEVTAPEAADLERYGQVVKSHLERFGSREELVLVLRPQSPE